MLTPERQTVICDALREGNYACTAAALAGICNSTYHAWLQRGRNGESPYMEFLDAVTLASAQGEQDRVADVKRAGNDDWRASAWMLERRHPERWANTQRIEVQVKKELDGALAKLEKELPPEVYESVINVLAVDNDSEAEAAGNTSSPQE